MDFESKNLKEFYLEHREELIKTAIKECEKYLDAWFDYDPVQKVFRFDGFNTDAI